MTREPGSTLSHYALVERIGAGGMGEVWKAHDRNLDRTVAIKLLSAGSLDDAVTRERFRREAHLLAKLSHAGIATIFDFDRDGGLDFLVMEHVPGGSLHDRLRQGPLEIGELLRLGAEIAEALAQAHDLGILHRDLKPANIVLTSSGQAKILDFGVARLQHASAASASLTAPGTMVGSLPYMAPEQLLGEAEDDRTDLYALGVLLYELSTGRRPFQKERPEAMMFEILNSAPPPLRALRAEAPAGLEALVERCLAKDRAQRPESARTVAEALRRLVMPAAAGSDAAADDIRSIAVLPFGNVSKDPEQEYFADGMTELLISELASIQALRVISRTSAMKYKGATLGLPEIARELNVDAVLEGSALQVAGRVRIHVRLVSARTDETRWSARYDRQVEDVLALQSEVAETVAREIAVQVTPREARQLARRSAVHAEAQDAYLKGRHHLAASSPQAVELALRHFQRALEFDSRFAPAWAGVAECHLVRASRGMAQPAEASALGFESVARALALDDSLAESHAALGTLKLNRRDFRGALESLQRAIELNPGLPSAHFILGRVYYCTERHPEAQREMLKALSLDPLSMIIHTTVGDAYYYARQYEKSVLYYRMAIELDPRFDGAHTDLARSLEALGHFDEARQQYEEGRRLAGGVAGPSFGLAHLEASSGREAEARRILAELTAARAHRVVSAWGIAALHASLGDVDEAFEWLERAVEEGATGLVFLRVHPRLDAIRGDARYPSLLERVGLA